MSLRASPAMLKARTVTVIAIPGQNMIQGFRVISSRPPLMMLPHVGVPRSTPTPRKERPASARIAPAVRKLAYTMIGATMFGRIWRARIRHVGTPTARAASTNIWFFRVRTDTRVILLAEGTEPKCQDENDILHGGTEGHYHRYG